MQALKHGDRIRLESWAVWEKRWRSYIHDIASSGVDWNSLLCRLFVGEVFHDGHFMLHDVNCVESESIMCRARNIYVCDEISNGRLSVDGGSEGRSDDVLIWWRGVTRFEMRHDYQMMTPIYDIAELSRQDRCCRLYIRLRDSSIDACNGEMVIEFDRCEFSVPGGNWLESYQGDAGPAALLSPLASSVNLALDALKQRRP